MKIGVVIAMTCEFEPMSKRLDFTQEQKFGKTFYRGKKNDNELIVVVGGVGEIASAAATQLMICAYDPDLIINVGVAGGLNDGLHFGEITVARGVVHYDFDTSDLDGIPSGQYAEIGSPIIPTSDVYKKVEAMGYRSVIIASADKFVANTGAKNKLISDFGADVCEMECAGVVLTAIRNNKQVIVLKMISDHADENANADFNALFDKNAETISKLVDLF